jgi:lysophospholipase L1-like esterase
MYPVHGATISVIIPRGAEEIASGADKEVTVKFIATVGLRNVCAGVGALLLPAIPLLAGRGGLISMIASRLWESQIRAYEKQDRLTPPIPGGVLFVGSSSIRRWDLEESFPGDGYINRGFGGSQVADAIRQAPRLILPHEPGLIVFYSGENDLAFGKSANQVCQNYERFCELIHQELPRAQILILLIKPSPARADVQDSVIRINDFLRDYCDLDSRRHHLDVYSPMLDASGQPRRELFVEDGLHLSPSGYALWTSLLTPEIERLLKLEPAPFNAAQKMDQSRERS